jgi:multisubunit Na+/H+ antiporter MnhB subunit
VGRNEWCILPDDLVVKDKMKILKALPLGIAPVLLMGYGWYLGQLHQSGPDIAGILLFITGAAGLALAMLFFLLTRKYTWHEKWYLNALTGLAGCGIVFALLLVYAKWHG